ncbi:phosphatase PAP2 family protein [Algoriphagus antarcticus]|uniref:Membrane-associated phospholipid phosphatase n=1 Tax=Algoriphagus antarcticus TaxID=238540 RepID=A0A3E0DWH6_9BACT|nr:phosphatase PAP2 family protein [Algoriphagus antarcticus]REG90414.1 membrane-associated phospholipid phosphatase [Algoriphagus antarcticus]
MKRKKTYAKEYFKAYCILLIVACLFLPLYEKGKFELIVNKAHDPIFDSVFAGITHLGDGAILILPIIFLLFVKYSYAILLAWSTLFHMIFVSLGKRVLFRGAPRPLEFLSGLDIYTVPGVHISHWNTFPSGHTTTIFMLTCALAMLSPKKIWLQLALLGIAILTGFSRIYLMQHFVLDVLAGSVLGVISAYGGRWLTLKFFSKKKFRKSLYPKRKRALGQLIPF